MQQKHPSLGVDCRRVQFALADGKESLSQELIAAMQHAFEYSLDKLRTLQGFLDGYKRKVFFIGRNLGVLNSTMNCQDANISVTTEATSVSGGVEKTLVMNHYLYQEQTIKIKL